ncbi:hypothetical protein BJ508DRAFT_92820 [Ascobolus immersus RN42]|uniref:Uncharacterized protein n=1 Tax=Ascobolus immersus RN42 TaxID=1160509 RepID=A0A3N4I9N4_ASCIM|nr:hypothetical protein BJ508DRAFT_92820 [Ascobolus immersus RN42]
MRYDHPTRLRGRKPLNSSSSSWQGSSFPHRLHLASFFDSCTSPTSWPCTAIYTFFISIWYHKSIRSLVLCQDSTLFISNTSIRLLAHVLQLLLLLPGFYCWTFIDYCYFERTITARRKTSCSFPTSIVSPTILCPSRRQQQTRSSSSYSSSLFHPPSSSPEHHS